MPYRVLRYEETPNPNALKCVLDATVAPGPRSHRTRDTATSDPTAQAIFAIDGVTSLLFSEGWMTINKSPATSWKSVKSALERVLATAP